MHCQDDKEVDMRILFFVAVFLVILPAAFSIAEDIYEEEPPGIEIPDEQKPIPEDKRYTATSEPLIRYDADGNGYLEPEEHREYLNAKYKEIQEAGETGVDSDILREYDANGDDTIDAREAQEIEDDIKGD